MDEDKNHDISRVDTGHSGSVGAGSGSTDSAVAVGIPFAVRAIIVVAVLAGIAVARWWMQ